MRSSGLVACEPLADDGTVLHATDLVAKCPDDYSMLPSWPEHGGPR